MMTTDIGLAAALAIRGFYPLASLISPSGRVAWNFEDGPEVTSARQAYFKGELQGSLLDYHFELKKFYLTVREAR